ncbi:MAG TPA: M48 family metalloprotease [Vicinamibacterales bacterium]|nr:M48 family metalloprotease [Vicinamibacterales bacterium]
MKSRIVVGMGMVVGLALAAPAAAQLGGQITKGAQQLKQAHDELTITDAEEKQIGGDISAKLRDKYGVVQDPAIHKYVTLVGSVLAQASSRPNLDWTFIVLDTDGVNAFAAPGGFVHITRGALALIQNEAELADVLGHEISHVTEKHTINAIRNEKVVSAGASATRSEVLQDVANAGYSKILENKYDRNQEKDADRLGVTLANKVGYAPAGLSAFLTRLADRNKNLKEPSGLFASHPETQDRIETLGKLIFSQKLAATATVAARYHASVVFKPVAVDSLGTVAPPPSSESSKPSSGSGGGKFGLGGLNPLGGQKTGNQTIASAGSRGVNPDRDAKGGPNKGLVVVTVTPAEIAEFRKGISG